MWIDFYARWWKPNAIKVGIGRLNAISGEAWNEDLSADPQDYLVVPEQPWLDGIKAADGSIKQFVAAPLGKGQPVEARLTREQEFGTLQLMVFEPKPGQFLSEPPPSEADGAECYGVSSDCELGLGAGGCMHQKIHPDEYGLDTWDPYNTGRLDVHILNSWMFRRITGNRPPRTPVSARQYARAGLPWFELYSEDKANVPTPLPLQGIKSVETPT